MEPARLTELRLTDFKSFHDEVLPLGKLTVLIGGNAVGKSNALEGLYALTRLSQGMTLRQALDGSSRNSSPIRGGSDGCAPLGRDTFRVGCSVADDGEEIGLDLEIHTGRELTVVSEAVEWEGGGYSVAPSAPATVPTHGRPSRLWTAQLGLFEDMGRAPLFDLHEETAARQLTTSLLQAFALDPDPRLMHQYVPRDEANLRPDGANLSSAIEALKSMDPSAFSTLEALTRAMTGGRVTGLDFVETDIGDVQLLLVEPAGAVPARLCSDGTLRFLAFATALLTAPRRDSGARAEKMIIIEEVERGLYPAQARMLLELMDRELTHRAASVLLTTHSPALLEALPGERHPDVIVCSRDPESGSSRLRRLTELPGYPELVAAGGLGEAVTGDGLEKAQRERHRTAREFFEFLESM